MELVSCFQNRKSTDMRMPNWVTGIIAGITVPISMVIALVVTWFCIRYRPCVSVSPDGHSDGNFPMSALIEADSEGEDTAV